MKLEVARILLVEDNPGDVLLVKKAFERGQIKNTLFVARDGEEAIDMLQKPEFRPDLVLLDLNIPKIPGQGVLTFIKTDPVLKRIPVVVLTSSEAEEDIARSFDSYVNSYIVKPVDFTKMAEAVRTMNDWWFVLGRLPQE